MSFESRPRWPILCLSLPAAVCVACLGGGGGGSACEEGNEGCRCFGNDTCLDGLECLSGLCVDPDGEDTDEGGAEVTDESGDATDDNSGSSSTGETDGAVAEETDASGSQGQSTDVAQTDDAATDAAEPNPASETDAAMTDEPVVPDEPAQACSTGSGSCSAGNALDCVGGQFVDRDCSACAVLDCGVACCGAIWPLVADAYPYERRDDLLTEFSVSSDSAFLAAEFDGGEQFAAIGFELDAPRSISPSAVAIDAAATGSITFEVSLEKNDETGCQYSTSGGLLLSELYCWGTWEATGYDGTAAKLLVRIKSLAAQSASLEVYAVSF